MKGRKKKLPFFGNAKKIQNQRKGKKRKEEKSSLKHIRTILLVYFIGGSSFLMGVIFFFSLSFILYALNLSFPPLLIVCIFIRTNRLKRKKKKTWF